MFNSLVVQTAFLGDLLLGIPLFKTVKELHPDGRLTVLCRKGLGSFLLASGLVDEVIEVDKKSKADWRRAKAHLKDRVFDLLVCPHQSTRSALFVMGLKAKRKIGFKSWFNGIIFDERIERSMRDPEVLRQLSLLKNEDQTIRMAINAFQRLQEMPGGRLAGGGLVTVPLKFNMALPSLTRLRNEFRNGGAWRSRLSSNLLSIDSEIQFKKKPIAVLAPGSVWATKMWTSQGFIGVGQMLTRKGYRVIVTGAEAEVSLCRDVASQIEGAVSLAGRTGLFESAQVLAMSDLLVCNDSGAMHLGACATTPTVAVFGPTVLDFGYRPWNDRSQVVQLDLDCRPCGTHGAKTCPLGTHACMKGIGIQEVSRAVEKVLS